MSPFGEKPRIASNLTTNLHRVHNKRIIYIFMLQELCSDLINLYRLHPLPLKRHEKHINQKDVSPQWLLYSTVKSTVEE